jgi:hypothetical protein
MPGNLYTSLLITIAWIPAMLQAQQYTSYPQLIEDLLYRNENAVIPEEQFDRQEEVQGVLLLLNSASQEEIEASSLFSPFQVHQLIEYRRQFGAIYSIYELAALPGFTTMKLRELEPRLLFSPVFDTPATRKSRHLLMLDVDTNYPQSMAYQEDPDNPGVKVFAGSPIHSTLRVKSQTAKHLSMALTFEKDPGEELFYKGKPQFLSGYVSYQGKRLLKQVVAGTFQLNQGLGLVNGSGFFHHPSTIRVNQQTLASLRPYASKTEQRFERGLATKWEWKSFQFLVWASCTSLDLSPISLGSESEQKRWWEHQRITGLHRTIGENEGRNLASRVSGGSQLLYRHREFALGIMTGTERMGLSNKGRAFLDKNLGPAIHHSASIHGTWLRGRWQLFGELAAEGSQAFAFQAGCMIHFSDYVQGTMLAYHYGKGYRGMLPSAYAIGSQADNEQGLAFHLHAEPGSLLVADFTGELSKYPGPRYNCLVPSSACRIDLSLRRPGIHPLQWRIRLLHKSWQSTPSHENSGVRPLIESRVSRLDGRFVYQPGPTLTWQSRLIISLLSDRTEPDPAYAVLQEASIQATPYLRGSLQFVVFQVQDWENRIYLHEPSFYYNFSYPSYYGSGQKTTLLLILKAIKGISLSIRISGIRYYDREESGTGKDLVKGNKLWKTGVQVRVNF